MIRLLRMTSAYPQYTRKFYATRPGMDIAPYATQLAALHADAYAWADFWSHALASHGYVVSEHVANVRPLQHAWAREHDMPVERATWCPAVALRQVMDFRPDVLFLDDFTLFDRAWIDEARSRSPGLRLVVGWCSAPYSSSIDFGVYDLVLSCIPEVVERLKQSAIPSMHLSHAFEPRILDRLGPRESRYDVSFIGQIVGGSEGHRQRLQMLEALRERSNIAIFSPTGDMNFGHEIGMQARKWSFRAMRAARRLGATDDQLAALPVVGRVARWLDEPPTNYLERMRQRRKLRLRPSVFGLDMFRTLRDSKVSFNTHIDLSGASASNMRLFEATGVGSCMVTDWKANLADYFVPEEEVVTYRSADECVEKIVWLLNDADARERIAAAGQQRTLRDHTFTRRAARFDAAIRGILHGDGTGARSTNSSSRSFPATSN